MSFEDKPSAEHLDNSSTTSESHVKTEEDVLVTWRTYIGVFAFCLTQVYQGKVILFFLPLVNK